eukprot:6034568-Pleurochrysis_carterae.AAC.2
MQNPTCTLREGSLCYQRAPACSPIDKAHTDQVIVAEDGRPLAGQGSSVYTRMLGQAMHELRCIGDGSMLCFTWILSAEEFLLLRTLFQFAVIG